MRLRPLRTQAWKRCCSGCWCRLLHNLIGNAIKYSPGKAAVQVQVGCVSNRAVITVRDHGVGIPPAELPQIGTPFFRASTATAPGIAGTGLGLSGSKAIVEQHGGTLALESTVGVGTVVTVHLPLSP